MNIDFNDLCELLTAKYRVDFIVIDKDFCILALSNGVHKFVDGKINKQDDIRDIFYELIGYENEFNSIIINIYCFRAF